MSAADLSRDIPIPLMAGGQVISDATADQAAEWLTLLMSGDATDEDKRRWQQWRDAHPDHERAWRHIEAVTGRFKLLQPTAAYSALSPYVSADAPRSRSRRKAIRALMWGGVACTTGVLASRTQGWQAVTADYRTFTGEQRDVVLDDGTRIMLNTDSAIDVSFDSRRRQVRLVAGEILIVTAHVADGISDSRPFIVETAEGSIRALGTRFTVRQEEGYTRVAVLESAVEITPANAAGPPRLLRAGEGVSFTRTTVDTPAAMDEQASAWARGQIIADNMRLDDFMVELGRYRRGLVRCDPAVSDLRLSGVFPLQDTDRILAMLPNVLPVRVRLRTRYWVTVEAAR